ncbi:MAG: ATP-dependent helicase [Bacteroidia bacterium]|nr:MAG: ATP-dependent helicase [Bacteroidia bacterium]
MTTTSPSLIIYNASAGSGKTTTLIKEILKIIIEGENGHFELRKVRQILGLTFTNAVANELKRRLVSVLFQIAKGDEAQFQKLKKIYFSNYTIDDDTIRRRAEEILYHILHHYSDVSLSTIDSFSNRILKSFAYDLNYSLVYNIATEPDEYYSRTIERFLDELETTDNQRFQWIMEFVRNRIEEDENYSIHKFIQEIVNVIQPLTEKEITNEELQNLKTRLSAIDEEKLKGTYYECRSYIKLQIEEFNTKIREKIEELGRTNNWYLCDRNKLEIEKQYDKIKVDGIKKLNKVYREPFLNFDLLGEADDFFAKRLKDYVENQREKDIEKVLEVFSSGKDLHYVELKNAYDTLNLFQQLLNNLLVTRLAIELLDVLNDLKKEDDVVFFSDFTREINNVIQNEESVDFIFEKIGTRYRHFLIDEFQDTSTMQFNNLLPLIHNAMAEGHTNYIVGDPKQSIYMWRNANVQQFINLAQYKSIGLTRLQKDWDAFKSQIESRTLNQNFRSANSIVHFNNAVFDNLNYEDLHLISRVYKEAEQLPCSDKVGYVEIIEYDCKELKNKELRQNEFLKDVLEKINECIDLGYHQKDICVLLRSKNEINFLINELSSKELKNGERLQFVAPEGLTVFQDEEVDFIIAFLKVLLNPDDKIAGAICWNYLLKKENKLLNDFYYDDNLKENIIIHLLKENKEFESIYYNLSKLDIYQLCLRIVEFFNISLNTAVQKLLNIVNLFVHQYSLQGNTLDVFLDFWEKNKFKFTIQVGKDVNAVKVYTIHKSKGLEFPVVITNINFKNKIEYNNFWYTIQNNFFIKFTIENKEVCIDDFQAMTMYLPFETIELLDNDFVQEKREEAHLEDINLIYVALTRAVNRLYVFGEVNNAYDSSKYYEKIIQPRVKVICSEKPIPKKHSEEESENKGKKIYCFGNYNEQPENKVTSSDTLSIDGLSLKYNSKVLLSDDANPYSDEIGIGIKVHKILEFVNNNDVEWALKKAMVKGLIGMDEVEKYKRVLNELVNHPELKKYFDSNAILYVLNELEIFSEDEEVYRPDKMIFTKQNEIVIFEFKTGKNLSVYKKQLSKYVCIVQSLYQDKNVIGYLIYLNNEAIECEKIEVLS